MKSISILLFVFISTLAFGQVTQTSNSKPFVLGTIEQFQSSILGESRTINIYLPEGYGQDDTTRYPVVYLLDGAADEDFIHIVGLYQFNNFPWIDRVPKSIVVGIVNVNRERDFTYPTTIDGDKKRFPATGKSDSFIRFIEKELQPFIDKKYNTASSKTIIGQSFGGLLATEILLKKPTLFNRYIIVSPSIWWDNGSLLNQESDLLQSSFQQPTQIYIGVGKEGLVPTSIPRVMEVDANLLAERLRSTKSKTVTIHFDYLPEENHATASHQAVFNALRLVHPEQK